MRLKMMVRATAVAAAALLIHPAFGGQADWTKRTPAHVPPTRSAPAMAQFNLGEAVVMFGGLTLTHDQSNLPVSQQLDDTWVWDGTDWTQITGFGLSNNGPHPPTRTEASMAFDPNTGMTVLFGGNHNSDLMNDTWLFHLGRNFVFGPSGLKSVLFYEWIPVNVPAGSGPAPRQDASMAYDPVSKTIIMTGGCCVLIPPATASVPYNDTWSFNTASATWTQLSVTNPPTPGRGLAAMSECGNSVQTTPQQILLFGGFQDVNFQDLNFPFGDTWVFQGTLQWAGPFFGARIPHPAARSGAGMAYYPVSNQAVLFGGLAASSSFPQDTWNGFCSPLSWTQVFPAHSPGGRFAPGMTTGPNGFTLVLFGGQGASPPFPPLNDTWTWGRRAACVPADGSQVSVGSEVKCQFDPADGIQFGGWSTNGFGPPFRHQLTATFHTAAPGAASIMAQWTDADGSHSETFSYTIARPNH